jgi:AcrR family transcriptional regulator
LFVTKGDETRREILGHALALASEVGLAGLSIGLLAERVGMSKSGLFAHFSSKERLQVAVLEEASERFVGLVVSPALRVARGKPRVAALFERWLLWSQQDFMPGGCIFFAAAGELDDRPGSARDQLVSSQRDLQETLAHAVRIAKSEGHFRADLDETQFVFELFGIMQSCYFHMRLMRDGQALPRAHRAFERLAQDASAPAAAPVQPRTKH